MRVILSFITSLIESVTSMFTKANMLVISFAFPKVLPLSHSPAKKLRRDQERKWKPPNGILLPTLFQASQPTCMSQECRRQPNYPLLHRKSARFHAVRVDLISCVQYRRSLGAIKGAGANGDSRVR